MTKVQLTNAIAAITDGTTTDELNVELGITTDTTVSQRDAIIADMKKQLADMNETGDDDDSQVATKSADDKLVVGKLIGTPMHNDGKFGESYALSLQTQDGIKRVWVGAGFIKNGKKNHLPKLTTGSTVIISYDQHIAGVTGYKSNGTWTISGEAAIKSGNKVKGEVFYQISSVDVAESESYQKQSAKVQANFDFAMGVSEEDAKAVGSKFAGMNLFA